jgi:hypothetical protein
MSTELDSAMNSANTLVDMCSKLMAERDQLKALNAELAANAARYRWLAAGAYESVIPHGGTLNGSRAAWITKLQPGPSFDAAIDAALAKHKESQA